ncbi:lytic transglycosylase domain-containing protein [Erythrobacter sp. WH131]|uniref:Lytic transglycosylase domain-containing protein n=2 Tax=Erythrobacter ani TaxID=2827235 RepID=A0ABS6SPL8_9SPHN|nr:lytic transglycosylase domain-containing protein [Erythrobacter ani]
MALKFTSSPLALAAVFATGLAAISVPVSAQSSGAIRPANLVAQQPTQISAAITRWERLQADDELRFSDYAGFVLAYPDFPRSEILRIRAENRLNEEAPAQSQLLSFFDAHPPLTNAGKARYAIALGSAQRPEALEVARAAWRGGSMSDPSEVYMLGLFGSQFTDADHAARMDALLWQGNTEAATRQLINIPSADREQALARLALIRGSTPQEAGLSVPASAMRDAGYVYNLLNHYRATGQTNAAIQLLANRQPFATPAIESEAFLDDMLAIAKAASASDTVRITSKIDDLFEPGQDISQGSFRLRDRYTDLMWMGGTNALWRLRDGARAAPLFERYGKAARTPLTRAKGFYWAGRAAREAGMAQEAQSYFEMAAAFPHYYYGQLALDAMGKPMPDFKALPQVQVDAVTRADFEQDSLTRAIRSIAANRRDWRTERRFFQAIGEKAETPEELLLVNNLAAETGLEEMAVVVGMEAGANGLVGFERVGFPTVNVPRVNDWTMVHAIARQESEFDRTRRSHANAIGMMQLLRSTAREEAGILGIQYMSASLTEDPLYNITLGDAHFSRRMDLYGGAYPLAIASYNAGPGRVREWLQLNGDPRRGEIDWVTWIEKIPANFETRYYVMRVIGNAVTYSHMYPEKAGLPRTVDTFLP